MRDFVERRCVLAVGSNLGNRLANLQDALRRMAPIVRIDRVSALYESDPMGPPGQPSYFNAVCSGLTTHEPDELLRDAKAIEWALGRRPGPRWGPRPLDIDLLLIDGVTRNTPLLTIPHPRIAERSFVLTPLADILPDLALANTGRTVADLAAAAGTEGLRRIAGPEWPELLYVGVAGSRPAVT
jgi:2-amino-4-hydroxy-6-hydroxymethyldihydropteridine diphosphokinase